MSSCPRMVGIFLRAVAVLCGLLGAVHPSEAGQARYDYDAVGRLVRAIDEQNRVTEYVYDAVGNLLRVLNGGQAQPPVISSITPSTLRQGETRHMEVTGVGLAGVVVVAGSSGLTVSGAQISATQVSFDLAVSGMAALGVQSLSLTNAAGTALASITVQPPLPLVTVAPTPVAVPPDATPHAFTVRLSNADVFDHTFTVSVADPSVADVTPVSFAITAGQTEFQASVAGLQDGQTTVSLASSTLGTTVVPLLVGAAAVVTEFNPPDTWGDDFIYNPLLNEIWVTWYSPVSGGYGITRLSRDGAVVGHISTPTRNFSEFFYNPVRQEAYVTQPYGQFLLNPSTATYVKSLNWSPYSNIITASPYDGTVWDGDLKGGNYYLSRYDVDTGAVAASYPTGTGAGIQKILFDKHGKIWFLSGGVLSVFDPALGTVEGTYSLPTTDDTAVYDPDLDVIWLVKWNNWTTPGELIAFSTTSRSIVRTYAAPPVSTTDGEALVYDSSRRLLWSGDSYSGLLTGTRTSDGSQYLQLNFGAQFGFWDLYQLMMVDSEVWVMDSGNGRIFRVQPGVNSSSTAPTPEVSQ